METVTTWRVIIATDGGGIVTRLASGEAAAERLAYGVLGHETRKGTVCRTIVEKSTGDGWTLVNEFEF